MDDDYLDAIIHDCSKCVSGIRSVDPHLIDISISRLDNHVGTFIDVTQQFSDIRIVLCLQELIRNLQTLREAANEEKNSNTSEESCDTNISGLQTDDVVRLRRMGSPWAKIAKLYGLSRQSIYKYRQKHGIMEPNLFINDEDLRTFIASCSVLHPFAGTGFIRGALLNAGFRASRKRVWLCLRQVDPVGTARRRKRCIARRVYKVTSSNSLWHIDSNHKLIMFRFVIHGCVDGYSRRIVYVNVAANNKADTVLSMLQKGISQCGFPERVRGDKGSENVSIKRFLEYTSTKPNPWITGRSVHNTRIERLWRDINLQVSFMYKTLFQTLEDDGVLDQHNDLHILLLHYIFLPRIQTSLDLFSLQWNNHQMRTLSHRTPLQSWSIGMMHQGFSPSSLISHGEALSNEELDSCDDTEHSSESEEESGSNRISIPSFSPELIHEVMEKCQQLLPDPLVEDGDSGRAHYINLLSHFSSP